MNQVEIKCKYLHILCVVCVITIRLIVFNCIGYVLLYVCVLLYYVVCVLLYCVSILLYYVRFMHCVVYVLLYCVVLLYSVVLSLFSVLG
jgi:hypothetical protein